MAPYARTIRAMAFRLTCDNPDCAEEIDAGPGHPGGNATDTLHCATCAATAARVEDILSREAIVATHETVAKLSARRSDLMRQMLPTSKGGLATAPAGDFPQVVAHG